MKTLPVRPTEKESGVSLAEIMVAIVVIAILLVASASAFTGAISANVASGNRNQAIQISQDIIAVAKQAPFAKIGIVSPTGANTPDTACSEPWTGKYNNLTIIPQTEIYPKLVYCQVFDIPETGMVYAAYTYVTAVGTNDFDSSTVPITTTGTKFVPKRITVKVVWFDKIQNNGEVSYQSVTQSYVRTPTIAECVPNANYSSGAATPPGCN